MSPVRLTLVLGTAFLLLAGAAALVSGAPWLVWAPSTGPEVPLGTHLAWMLLIGAAILGGLLACGRATRRAAGVMLAVAIAWLPASVVAAGNGRLIFRGGAVAETWTILTYRVIPLLLLAVIAAGLLERVIGAWSRRRRDGHDGRPGRVR